MNESASLPREENHEESPGNPGTGPGPAVPGRLGLARNPHTPDLAFSRRAAFVMILVPVFLLALALVPRAVCPPRRPSFPPPPVEAWEEIPPVPLFSKGMTRLGPRAKITTFPAFAPTYRKRTLSLKVARWSRSPPPIGLPGFLVWWRGNKSSSRRSSSPAKAGSREPGYF